MPTTASLNFVGQLYQTEVLRQGTTSDLDYWANQLDAGTVTQLQVANDFAMSREAQQLVLPIARLYQTFFGRAPDAGGLQSWVTDFRGGMSLTSIASQFVQSTEFQTHYGVSPTPFNFLTALYRDVLGRLPDPAGAQFWTDQLNQGGNSVTAEAAVALGFSNSAEFIADSTTPIDTWLVAAGLSGTYSTFIQGMPDGGGGFSLVSSQHTATITGSGIFDASVLTGITTLNVVDTAPAVRFMLNDVEIDNLAGGIVVGLGDTAGHPYAAGKELDLDLVDQAVAGASDPLTVDLNNVGETTLNSSHWPNANFTLAGSGNIVRAFGIENFTFNVATTGDQSFFISVAYPNTDSNPGSITFIGGQTSQVVALGVNGIPANMTTIDASGLASDLVFGSNSRGSRPPPLTVIGGTGWNEIAFSNSGDVLNGGPSGHNTLLVNTQTSAANIGYNFDLSVPSEQNEVVAFVPPGTIQPTVTNFQNIDLSLLGVPDPTVSPIVKGSPAGSIIVASEFGDTITLSASGSGANVIVPAGGTYFGGIDVDAPVGGVTTFAHYMNVANFDAAGRTDFIAFPASLNQVPVSPGYHAGPVGLAPLPGGVPGEIGSFIFFVPPSGTATTLTSATSVAAAIGSVGGGSAIVILDNGATAALSTQFAIYSVDASENLPAPLATNPHETITLLGLFNAPGGFSTANYYAPISG